MMEQLDKMPADLSKIDASVVVFDDHFAINSSTRCQHRCVYCFEGERDGYREIPTNDVIELLKQAATKVKAVVLMGAEATLRSDFAEIVAAGTALGLEMRLSTNALRFSDNEFLKATIDAGLKAVELSFPYPDVEVYKAITGAKETGFQMLLQALDNIRLDGRMGCNVNVVVSSFNIDRLDAVIDLAAQHLGSAIALLTLKRCQDNEPSRVVTATQLRDALIPLLSGWRHSFPVILRGFPMCTVPGFEHLDADLVYIRQGVTVSDNFQRQDEFMSMYGPAVAASANPLPECKICSLRDICYSRQVFREKPNDPGNLPISSSKDPRQVLVANRTDPKDVELTISRLIAGKEAVLAGKQS
ncbi:MAG: radical SAM protein [Myxococcota bacterium]|jgi:organic radical activating enzyme